MNGSHYKLRGYLGWHLYSSINWNVCYVVQGPSAEEWNRQIVPSSSACTDISQESGLLLSQVPWNNYKNFTIVFFALNFLIELGELYPGEMETFLTSLGFRITKLNCFGGWKVPKAVEDFISEVLGIALWKILEKIIGGDLGRTNLHIIIYLKKLLNSF